MSERYCVRGCTIRGKHYATCPDYGMAEAFEEARAAGVPHISYTPVCNGCAPRECRDGSLICDRCFGWMRALLADGPDLMGRLYSLADPMKATPTDKTPGGRSSATEPPAPVSADLLDAIACLGHLDPWWHADLAQYLNDGEVIAWLGKVVLDRHPEDDGARELWSVQDAVDKWGVERRTDTFVYPDDDTEEIELQPVHEWFDRLLTIQQAARRAKVSQRQVQRWVAKDLLTIVARHRGPRGSVIKYVRASAVDVAAKQMRTNQQESRFAAAARAAVGGAGHD